MNIFDAELSAATKIDQYRSWVVPELYPAEWPARIENWHPEDLAAFCGGKFCLPRGATG